MKFRAAVPNPTDVERKKNCIFRIFEKENKKNTSNNTQKGVEISNKEYNTDDMSLIPHF